MKLYGRLLAMASMVSQGEKIADIGTDHGLLPIFLLKNNISPKAVLVDINKGPLARARANFDLYLPGVLAENMPDSEEGFKAEFRLGDGLLPLRNGEVDTVIIAGMGGELIAEILAQDFEKTKSFKKFILQPRTKISDLRLFLHNYAFEIRTEKLVREGKFICEIIMALPAIREENYQKNSKKDYKEIDLEISPLLISAKDPLLEEYIRDKINKETYIMKEIQEKGSYNNFHKVEKAKARIEELSRILNKYGG